MFGGTLGEFQSGDERYLLLGYVGLVGAVLLYFVHSWFRLRHVPGPKLSSLSNLPRFLWVKSRRAHEIQYALHNKYGKLVRMGPRMVSVSDPAAIPVIYGFDGKFKKSDLYAVFRPYSKKKVITGMVAQQDEEHHKMLRKPFATVYSAKSLEPLEPLVTEPIDLFVAQLKKCSKRQDEINFGFWVQLCVWDILCSLTFSKRFGFLDQGEDVGQMLELVWKQFQDGAPISQMPWYDYVWRKNPILLRLMPGFRMTPIVPFSLGQIKNRAMQAKEQNVAPNDQHPDVLSRFMAAQANDVSVPDWALLTWTLGGLGAGGDTSANVIRALFYNLFAHPKTLHRLESEISKAKKSDGQLTWREIRSIAYLDACIKEAARIQPSIGLPLERVVPVGGAKISGCYFPEGTVVGINAWVVNRDNEIYGEDANTWRPERWLCEKENRNKMEQTLFTFGAGHRVCPGQTLFSLMISKMIVSIIEEFTAELVDPEKPAQIENSWLVRQSGFIVRLMDKA